MSAPALPSVNPFGRMGWTGRLISVDGTSAEDFADTVEPEVIAAGESAPGWDGEVACVMRLPDGRFVAYETQWGPTGDGFCCDAYGGDADLFFGATADAVIWLGLSATGRQLCGYPAERP
jgi:hypothetical protein